MTYFLLIRARISSVTLIRAVWVLLFFLKPVCMQSRMLLYVSMWPLICLCTIYSIAFERQLSNDMGLKSFGLLGAFILFNAITIDFFHSERKTDCLIDALISSRRWGIDGRVAAMKHWGMPSERERERERERGLCEAAIAIHVKGGIWGVSRQLSKQGARAPNRAISTSCLRY